MNKWINEGKRTPRLRGDNVIQRCPLLVKQEEGQRKSIHQSQRFATSLPPFTDRPLKIFPKWYAKLKFSGFLAWLLKWSCKGSPAPHSPLFLVLRSLVSERASVKMQQENKGIQRNVLPRWPAELTHWLPWCHIRKEMGKLGQEKRHSPVIRDWLSCNS